jgi:hypothetical protein
MKYKLINPMIVGSMKTNIEADDADKAAVLIWENISKDMTNNVPKMGFSLKDQDNKMHNFIVEEEINENNINYKIYPVYLDKIDEKKYIKYTDNLEKKIYKQAGGHKKHYDDSSSDSDDDTYKRLKLWRKKNSTNNFLYWWYNPYMYNYCNECTTNSLYIPTFVYPYTPYIEICTSNRFMSR